MFKSVLIILGFVVGANVIVAAASDAPPPAQTLYFGGPIVTMEGDTPEYVEAVVTRDGVIIYAGKKSGVASNFPGKMAIVDLQGKTMLPGFIEPHVHPSIAALILSGDIIAPHDWNVPEGLKKGVEGHDAYIARLKQSIEQRGEKGEVLFVWGYHQLWHGELNRTMLNRISPDIPVAVIHRSFHEVFLNDTAIALFGIKEDDFKDNPQVEWDKGHFFEGGWLALVPKIAPVLIDPVRYKRGLADMTKLIRRSGVTTIAEQGFPGSSFDMEYALLKSEMDKRPPYDVYNVLNGTQLARMNEGDEQAEAFIDKAAVNYDTQNIFMLPKQVKLFADGAIYSLAMQMEDGYSDGFEGEWMTPPALLEQQMNFYWDRGYKIHVHANGDLGIQLVLDITDRMMRRNARTNHRLTLHHLGYFTDPQAEQIQQLGIEVSANPYYLWALADKYSEYGLGPERARSLVQLKSLKDQDVPFSLHSDFGMAPLEPLNLAWTAVNRVTSRGTLVSSDQRIDVFTAMQGVTLNAARTLQLENELGSIKVGKTANFTLLDENPFKVQAMHLKDIRVAGVVYRGRVEMNANR